MNKVSLNQWTFQFNTAGVCSMTTFCTISRWQRTKEPWQFLPKLSCRWPVILEIWVTETLHSLQSAVVRSPNRKSKVFNRKKIKRLKTYVQLPLCNLYMFQLNHRSCPQEHSKEARKRKKKPVSYNKVIVYFDCFRKKIILNLHLFSQSFVQIFFFNLAPFLCKY